MKTHATLREGSWTETPNQNIQIYNPAFRAMTIKQLEAETRSYAEYGYIEGIFDRNLATIFLFTKD